MTAWNHGKLKNCKLFFTVISWIILSKNYPNSSTKLLVGCSIINIQTFFFFGYSLFFSCNTWNNVFQLYDYFHILYLFCLLFIWVKVFHNGPSKICGRQPLKNSAHAGHITSKYLKVVWHKFYLSVLEYLDPFERQFLGVYRTLSNFMGLFLRN